MNDKPFLAQVQKGSVQYKRLIIRMAFREQVFSFISPLRMDSKQNKIHGN